MTTTTTDPRPAEEVEAAELEGFLEIAHIPEAMAMVWSYKTMRRTAADASKEKGRVGNRLMEYIEQHGAKVLTIGGQVFARKQVSHSRTVFDEDAFKAAHPELHREFMTKTVSGSTRLWVRPQDGDEA
jgi:hypothetical protein